LKTTKILQTYKSDKQIIRSKTHIFNEDKIIGIFYLTDEFYQEFDKTVSNH